MTARTMALAALVALAALTAPSALAAAGVPLGDLAPVGHASAAVVCTSGYQQHPDGTRSCQGIYIQP